MAIGHIAVRVHSRKRGHTVAAALAYRCGLDLRCGRTGERFDFRRRAARSEIAAAGFVGTSAPGRYAPSRMRRVAQAFADAVEAGERRSNASILRDVQMALPHELQGEDRIALTERFAAQISARYNVPVAFAVHAPDAHGDGRNHHAHIVVPTRNRDGKKLRVLDDRRSGPEEIKAIRKLWEEFANAALVAAGKSPTVDTGRRLDEHPQPTLGTERTGRERRHRRERRLPYEGRSVAKMCADGHSCTGAGRRLGRHVREKEETEYERLTAQLMAEEEVAALPDETRSPAEPPETETPIPPPKRARRRHRRQAAEPKIRQAAKIPDEAPEAEIGITTTPELHRPPQAEPQNLERALRALERKRAQLALAPAASIAAQAWDLINAREDRETMPTPTRIESGSIDWRTLNHVEPDIVLAATRARERVSETETKTPGTPRSAARNPAPTPNAHPSGRRTPEKTPAVPPTATPGADERIALDSLDLRTLRHVEPAPPPAQSASTAALSSADREAWQSLRREPITRLELQMIRRQIDGSPTQPSLAHAVDAIARAHLDGRTAGGDHLQSARETLASVLRSEAATMDGAHLLIDALDAHARAGAGIESWRAQWDDTKKRLLRTVLPREVLELRADARRETARAKHTRRQRFGIIRRGSGTENTDDGHDR